MLKYISEALTAYTNLYSYLLSCNFRTDRKIKEILKLIDRNIGTIILELHFDIISIKITLIFYNSNEHRIVVKIFVKKF